MKPGDTAIVAFPGNGLHGKRVRIERAPEAVDIAHPDCAERLVCMLAFISHPSLPQPVGISPAHLRDVRSEILPEGVSGGCAGVAPQLSAQGERDRGSAARQLDLFGG
jgi:hypothetical protein